MDRISVKDLRKGDLFKEHSEFDEISYRVIDDAVFDPNSNYWSVSAFNDFDGGIVEFGENHEPSIYSPILYKFGDGKKRQESSDRMEKHRPRLKEIATRAAVYDLLIYHLGSREAADNWLNLKDEKYKYTNMEMMMNGKAESVFLDVLTNFGPSPNYS